MDDKTEQELLLHVAAGTDPLTATPLLPHHEKPPQARRLSPYPSRDSVLPMGRALPLAPGRNPRTEHPAAVAMIGVAG